MTDDETPIAIPEPIASVVERLGASMLVVKRLVAGFEPELEAALLNLTPGIQGVSEWLPRLVAAIRRTRRAAQASREIIERGGQTAELCAWRDATEALRDRLESCCVAGLMLACDLHDETDERWAILAIGDFHDMLEAVEPAIEAFLAADRGATLTAALRGINRGFDDADGSGADALLDFMRAGRGANAREALFVVAQSSPGLAGAAARGGESLRRYLSTAVQKKANSIGAEFGTDFELGAADREALGVDKRAARRLKSEPDERMKRVVLDESSMTSVQPPDDALLLQVLDRVARSDRERKMLRLIAEGANQIDAARLAGLSSSDFKALQSRARKHLHKPA